MKIYELKLIAQMLEMASSEFGNHGCNDFDLKAALPDDAERTELATSLTAWVSDGESTEVDTRYAADWLLMSYLRSRLLGAIREMKSVSDDQAQAPDVATDETSRQSTQCGVGLEVEAPPLGDIGDDLKW
jgi:hypothetical protein